MNKEQFVVALICNKFTVRPIEKSEKDLFKVDVEKTMFYSDNDLSFDYVERLDLDSITDFEKELGRIRKSYEDEFNILQNRKFKVRSYKYA